MRLALALVPLLALGACVTGHEHAAEPVAVTPTQQFPFKAVEHPDEVRLAAHDSGLSPAQVAAVSDLAGRWLQGRQPVVTIQTPSHGADPRAAETTSFAARALLVSLGVPAERVERATYEPSGEGQAPVIVGFKAYEAVTPKCGQNFDRVDATASNLPMANFGCAVTANMAAQISDPGDIVAPRKADAAPADRRAFVLDKYRQGQPTSTTPDKQASGAISSSSSSGS
jgi:pilus assembly protein CpaD